MSVLKKEVTVDEYGILNTASIDRESHAPPIINHTQLTTTSAQPKLDLPKHSTPSGARENQSDKDEYVVDRIVRHIGEENELCYGVP